MIKIILSAFIGFALGFTIYHMAYNDGYRQGYRTAIEEAAAAMEANHTIQTAYILERMAFYESSNHHKVWGDCNTDGSCLAYGIYQFHSRTFHALAKKAGKPELKWKNEADQRWLAKWAVEHGYGRLWLHTYRRALQDYYERIGT